MRRTPSSLTAALAALLLSPTGPSGCSPSSKEASTASDSESPPVDQDGDGFAEEDCDDADPNSYPGAIELCDLVDNDCDGSVADETEKVTLFPDDGPPVDLTNQLGVVGFDAPVVELSEPGVLAFCGGEWGGQLRVSADLHIEGLSELPPLLDGNGERTPLVVQGDGLTVSLTHFGLSGGAATESVDERLVGGLVYVSGAALVLDQVTMEGGTADAGGALALLDASVEATGLTIADVSATQAPGGVVYAERSELRAEDVEVSGVSASSAAVADLHGSVVELTRLQVADCPSTGGDGGHFRALDGSALVVREAELPPCSVGRGGAVYAQGSSVELDQAELADFSATGDGGVVYGADAELVLRSLVISQPAAGDKGGAVAAVGGSVTIEDVTISTPDAGDNGGGAYLLGVEASISGLTITEGSGSGAGGLHIEDSTVEVVDATLTDIDGGGGCGGAIRLSRSVASFSGLTVERAVATTCGAGIWVSASSELVVEDSAFRDCFVRYDNRGIAIQLDGASSDATFIRTVFEDNSMTDYDNVTETGGAQVVWGGELHCEDCDFDNNFPYDTNVGDRTRGYTWGTGATFSCTTTRCR